MTWPTELREHRAKIGVAVQSMMRSASPAEKPNLARVLWNCGERRPDLVDILMQGVAPCPAGIRCIRFLADAGALATPYRTTLSDLAETRRRARCEHVGDRLVDADEEYQTALRRALEAIPPDPGHRTGVGGQ